MSTTAPKVFAAFLPPAVLAPVSLPRRPRRPVDLGHHVPLTPSRHTPKRVSMCTARPPTHEKRLRLERALAQAVRQERYTDAASLRDALDALRTSDPVYSLRSALADAVAQQDFATAARLRDDLANLTERLAKGDSDARRVNRIIVLRGRADAQNVLRVSTVSPSGELALPLNPDDPSSPTTPQTSTSTSSVSAPDAFASGAQTMQGAQSPQPRVYLQPTWSPSGDFIAMTEISFNIDTSRIARGVAVAEASSTLIIMDAFDATIVRAIPLKKPPFFYYWSPDGQVLTLLSNDPTSTVTTVALSAIQVVAPAGAQGLDLHSVTGPIASGHPFLYDFCPRDSSRIVAHMGDCSTVVVIPVSDSFRKRRVLTSSAGTFGTPQWHPQVGRDGREVVFFVETEPQAPNLAEVDEDDDTDSDADESHSFGKFIANGSSLLESVLRKGAQSLGLTAHKVGQALAPEQAPDRSAIEEKVKQLEEKLRQMLPSKIEQLGDDAVAIIELDDDGVQTSSSDPSSQEEKPINRLVMCDVDRPEIRRTISRFAGVMAFKLSPNSKALAMLISDPNSGDDEFTICRGDFSPDSVVNDEDKRFKLNNPFDRNIFNEADIILSTPGTKVVAFFWSPDSSKLLFLCTIRNSKLGAAQWATFDLQTSKVVRYEKFVMSGIYIHCLNFFDQFAMSMTPWSPDSDAFCYPGRPLTPAELERDEDVISTGSPSLASLFIQRESLTEGRRFAARVQKVANTSAGNTKPEDATTIADNVEYACWSPC